jgi:ParB family chromosome partitioning protein
VPERGIGRGLSALLAVSHEEDDDRAGGQSLRELAIEAIRPNPRQPRRRFDETALQGLADSVRERGVLQPVLVRPAPTGGFELVAGERRWRAARLAGLGTVPALVRERDDAAALELALIENMAREDLNPIEEAQACAALVEELGLTREEVGRRVGRSRVAVSNLLRLLDLPDEALALVESGALTEGHGRALLLADDHADRRSLARSAAQEGWSVRVLEDRARAANGAGGGARARRGQRRAGGVHPDQQAAALELADALASAFGVEVSVQPSRAGFRAELALADLDEGLELARRLGAQRGP